jgi:hypothetical protein
MMKNKYTVIILAFIFIAISLSAKGQSAKPTDGRTSQDLEFKVKAAFLYNFIKFVNWPDSTDSDSNKIMTFGIIGKNTFGNAFEPVNDKKTKEQEVVVKYFNSFSELQKNNDNLSKATEELSKCQLLFICSSETNNLANIINIVKNKNILTVGETKDFLKAGGIINFILEDNKVRFEINLLAAKEAKLTIRSQLLRLAQKVIDEKTELKEESTNK